MEIIYVNPKDLKFAEYNPRKMNDKEANALIESIKRFGFVDPLVVNNHEGRENVVIGGHQRARIALEQEFESVPVVYVSLDEKRERELNLRLNKNLGGWDYDMLANFAEEELIDVGFDSQELDRIFIGELEEDEFDAQKEYEQIEEPKSKYGEIYELDRHRLICGDSTKREDMEKLMNGEKADLIYTDPPYNVGYDYKISFVEGRRRKSPFKAFNDKKTKEEFIEFIKLSFQNAYEFTKDYAPFYCWHASQTDPLFREGLTQSGWKISLTIFWLKNNCTFSKGLDYLWAIEPCFYGWKNKQKHYVNKKLNDSMKNIIALDINDFSELPNVWYEARDKIKEYQHPTQKPIRLAERALKKSSQQNSIILDLFGGSGSTLIACEQMNRICYMMELDPKYTDVIINRWEKFTGLKAKKLY